MPICPAYHWHVEASFLLYHLYMLELSLIPRLLPSFLSHTKAEEEPEKKAT